MGISTHFQLDGSLKVLDMCKNTLIVSGFSTQNSPILIFGKALG